MQMPSTYPCFLGSFLAKSLEEEIQEFPLSQVGSRGLAPPTPSSAHVPPAALPAPANLAVARGTEGQVQQLFSNLPKKANHQG